MTEVKTKKLDQQVAIVTGASSGIGAGIAKTFAAAGAQVVVNYSSSAEKAAEVLNEIIAAGGKGLAFKADVSVERGSQPALSGNNKASGYGRYSYQ